MRRIQLFGALVAACALVALPAGAGAHHRDGHTKGPSAKSCVINVAFVVKGTLVSYTPDTAGTPGNEASVTLTLTKANRHARRSGELQDADPVRPGTQLTFAASTDANGFRVQLSGYEANEIPAEGDKVRVIGKIAYTKARCAPTASVEARYGEENVRKVKIIEVD